MTGFRNRFGALASWWFAFTRDLRRERTFTSRDVGVLRDVYGDQAQRLVSATKTAGRGRRYPLPQHHRSGVAAALGGAGETRPRHLVSRPASWAA